MVCDVDEGKEEDKEEGDWDGWYDERESGEIVDCDAIL